MSKLSLAEEEANTNPKFGTGMHVKEKMKKVALLKEDLTSV